MSKNRFTTQHTPTHRLAEFTVDKRRLPDVDFDNENICLFVNGKRVTADYVFNGENHFTFYYYPGFDNPRFESVNG